MEKPLLPVIKHNPKELFPQYRSYSHAIEVGGDSRILFISGLNGYESDGKTMPESFTEQADIIWTHIGNILDSAHMSYDNIISIRTYLASPEYDEDNVQIRMKYMGDNQPSSTVICCQLLEPTWKLEVEAVAAT